MIVIIYTYPPDFVAAAHAARAWQALGVRPYLAIDRLGPALRVEGIDVLRTDFERNGNLNGMEFVRGHLRLMRDLADGDAYQLKADSDGMAFGMSWLDGRTETAVGLWEEGHRGFFGFCYAIRTDALDAMIAEADAMPNGSSVPEDITMGDIADACGSVYRYENLAPGCPLAAYAWNSKDPIAEWKGRYDVLCFQRTGGRTHRKIAEKMKEFRHGAEDDATLLRPLSPTRESLPT